MMHKLPTALAFALSAVAGFAAIAAAMPPPHEIAPMPAIAATPVGGCHAEVRRHFVPEFGRSMRHFHRRNCRPVAADESRDRRADCHRSPALHFIPGAGMVYHRHVGENCAVRVIRRGSSG